MNRPATAGIDSAPNTSPPAHRQPTQARLDDQLRDAARLVISPTGHADDDRLQAAFKLLRARAPVYWADIPGVRPFWLISRHADVIAVERRGAPFSAEPRSFLSSEMAEDRLRRILGRPYVLRGLLQMDDPDHAAYRAVAQPWFTPAALAALEPWLTDWAGKIVERAAGRAEVFDFVEEIAVPFSIRGIMRLMGLPEADDRLILKLSRGLVGPEDPLRRLADQPTEALCRAAMGFRDYFDPVATDRRTCPRGDLSSVIANARVHDAPMAEYELHSYYMMIATGGHDTIAFCLSGGMQALLANPDQFARLRSDLTLIDTAIEEMLRWTTPGRHIMRTATADSELGGQTIRAGEAVALFLNSADRDETVFAAADTFRIDRRPNPHVAFGIGQHFCIGAHLARMEMRALFKALLPRLAAAEPGAPTSRTHSTMVTGIASLPVRFTWR
jgi:cytochrome P450